MKPEKEAAYILGGTAVIEAGPGIVEDSFNDAGFGFDSIKDTPLGNSVENAVD